MPNISKKLIVGYKIERYWYTYNDKLSADLNLMQFLLKAKKIP